MGHLIIGVLSLLLVIGLWLYLGITSNANIVYYLGVQLKGGYSYNYETCVVASFHTHCNVPKMKVGLERMTRVDVIYNM